MNRKYLKAVVVAIIILIINQLFIQYFLYSKKYDAKTINLAGRQRMLSQKITLEVYRIVTDNHSIAELPGLFEEWEQAHHSLLYTPETSGLSTISHPEALELMSALCSRIEFMGQQVERLTGSQAVDLASINANQDAFLNDMNRVVALLEQSSSDKLTFIVRTEIVLLVLSILIILLEAIYIFYPIHQQLLLSLSDLRKSQKELQHHVSELTTKNRDLAQFVYVASHDLQEPLRTIISFIQLLQRKYQEKIGELGQREITFIIDATKRMKGLLTGLLSYTNIGREKAIKTVDCNQLIAAVEQDLQTMLEENNAVLAVEDLPTLSGYEIELRLLFQNLIVNAVKFQKDGVAPVVIVSAKELDTSYQFSVKDNGIGISEEFHEQIFQIFKRLHPVDTYHGTGIGLANCQKIAELHNGEIWVESEEGAGSTFYVTIGKSVG